MPLRSLFTPLISYTLLFAQTPEEQARSFDEIRARYDGIFETHRETLKREDLSPDDYEDGCFAVLAWIDETVLEHAAETNPTLFDAWRSSPLQVARFHTANAGEEFYDRLARLDPSRKQVYELFFLALCLGFKGRYYDEAREPQLLELRRQCAAHLPSPPVDLFEFETSGDHLTPQPYSIQPPPPRTLRKPVSPYWLAVPLAAAAALILYWIWPHGPDPREIDAVLASFNCSRLARASIAHDVVNIEGRIDSEDDQAQLRRQLADLRGVKGVELEGVEVIQRPFCEVLEVLGPVREANQRDGAALQLHLGKGCPGSYHDGDLLTIDVDSSKPLRYVYIDYYVADRESVAHVFPSVQQPSPAVDQAQAVSVGNETDKNKWAIGPPFGRELVTAIASSKPLFTPPRLKPESAEEYVAVLRDVLHASGAEIAANYCFTTSAP